MMSIAISSQIPNWFHLVPVRIWLESFRWNQSESLELGGIQLEKLERFPTNLAGSLLPNFRSESNWFQLVEYDAARCEEGYRYH
jgi:hypothetical protein